MVSTVKSRPNHYEMLGLAPAASSDEIARAFTREIAKPRAFGGIAHISIAYETLRDPAKRRAYDESLGLGPKPEPEPELRHLAAYRLRPVETRVSALPWTAPPAEPRTGSFIAASLRAPVEPEPHLETVAPTRPQAEPPLSVPAIEADRKFEPEPAPPIRRVEPASAALEADERPLDWKRAAVAAGALVAAVGLFGAWAGWEAGNDIDPEQPPTERAVTAALPPAKPVAPPSAVPASEPAPILAEARRDRPRRGTIAEARPTPTPAPSIAPEERLADIAEGLQGPPQEIASEPAVAEAAPAVAAVAASMPLPNSVIARTIGRIGYPCGKVSSTAAIEGDSPGAFKVTCSSGHSYRAAPVRGRYHFKRLGSQ